jgi:hypothetical protein
MGEAADSLNQPQELVHEVREIRENLTGIVRELDHRRHELFDWRLQLRRHAGFVTILAGATVLLVAGSILMSVRRRRIERRTMTRVKKMRRAVARFVDDPDRVVPREPAVSKKVLAAALTAAAATAGKKASERVFRQVMER